MPLTFRLFEKCKPSELIRGNIGDGIHWAICCRAGSRSNAVILDGSTRWTATPLENDYGFVGPFDGAACLSYGDKYKILPHHDGVCELDQIGQNTSELVRTPGAFVYAASVDVELNSFLVVHLGQRIAYLNLSSGILQSEPGGFRAAFASWTLWKDDMAGIAPSKALISTS